MKNLVIVESPTKAKTISRFLSGDFMVESSYGHIRDLPTYKLGVDVENNFEPEYVISRKSQPVVKKLKEEAKKAAKIILATDEDREGEAIAWHLTQALILGNSKISASAPQGKAAANKQKTGVKKTISAKTQNPNIERIVFHEITEKAILEALKHPRMIDEKLVNAQQARRVLDRLVGYQLSPFLWKKVTRGLSAGRVQSVAVRLVVEREKEIKNFKAEEYWTIEAFLKKRGGLDAPVFPATLVQINGNVLDKFAVKNEEDAKRITRELEDAEWNVDLVEKKASSKKAFPPFTTSTLQQEAWRHLRFSAKQTMLIAQQLYEGVEIEGRPTGLITYMRTDSTNLSQDSLASAKDVINGLFGSNYSLPSPRIFKTKSKGAQEAHEAIRPADPAITPDSLKNSLNKNQFRLYDLIWRRFIACQMPDAIFENTSADINAGPNHVFRANGQVMKFDGFLKVYLMKIGEAFLPELEKSELLDLVELKPFQHFTEPPPRFTEASLVKILEKFGIGRPSTYAPTMSTIQDRGYVIKNQDKRFEPTEIGYVVNDLLTEHFPEVVDVQFTAKIEEELDEIAEGKKEWRPVIREFYGPFEKKLKEKFEEVEKHKPEETTDEICEKCGKPMIVRLGRYGKFLACSGFPECKTTKSLNKKVGAEGAGGQVLDMACPKCVEGNVIIKRTRRGKIFYGCSRYPNCDFAVWNKPTGEKCPKCGGVLTEDARGNIKCANKECNYKLKNIDKVKQE